MKIRKLKAAAALGSLTASVALLAGMSGAHAQGAPGAGSFPGSFLVPGTQTSFKVGGYIKFDYTYDFGPQQNINGGASPFGVSFDSKVVGGFACRQISGSTILDQNPCVVGEDSGHHIHGNSQMTASESRFNIETRTPTAYGELKTFIEGDFTNPNGLSNSNSLHVNSNSYGFRLRQAYGTLGPFLAGQTLSLFRDGAAEAETLDFGGAQATGRTRTPQARYTFDFGNGLTWAAAAENPQTQIAEDLSNSHSCLSPGCTTNVNLHGTDVTRSTFGQGLGDKIPDFTTALVYNAPWGHLNVHGVFRDLYWHQNTNRLRLSGLSSRGRITSANQDTGNLSSSDFGWAIGIGGNWNVPIGKDSLAWEAAYGKGGGAYVNSDGPPTPDASLSCDDVGCGIKAITSWLVAANYTHFWTDTLRSNIAGSYWHQENGSQPGVCRGGVGPCTSGSKFDDQTDFFFQFKETFTAHANLIWSPVPQTNFGIEYIWMRGKLQDGQKGDLNRVQASAQFKF